MSGAAAESTSHRFASKTGTVILFIFIHHTSHKVSTYHNLCNLALNFLVPATLHCTSFSSIQPSQPRTAFILSTLRIILLHFNVLLELKMLEHLIPTISVPGLVMLSLPMLHALFSIIFQHRCRLICTAHVDYCT